MRAALSVVVVLVLSVPASAQAPRPSLLDEDACLLPFVVPVTLCSRFQRPIAAA